MLAAILNLKYSNIKFPLTMDLPLLLVVNCDNINLLQVSPYTQGKKNEQNKILLPACTHPIFLKEETLKTCVFLSDQNHQQAESDCQSYKYMYTQHKTEHCLWHKKIWWLSFCRFYSNIPDIFLHQKLLQTISVTA